MKCLRPFLFASAVALLSFAPLTDSANAETIDVFGGATGVSDTSTFTALDGTPGSAEVSVIGGQLSILDNNTTDAPEGYVDFGNVLNGVRLEFDFEFNNDALTISGSDPEILVRFGNNGVETDSTVRTGFQLNLRHETDDSTNQVRAANGTSSTNGNGNGPGTGLGSSTGFTNVADGTSFNVVALINNATFSQDYAELGGGTVAANTYDLFIDGTLIGNYNLSAGSAGYDPTLGLGTFGLNSSGSSDAGAQILFDNITIGLNADNGFTAVPEPSSALLLVGGLFSLGLMRRRNS